MEGYKHTLEWHNSALDPNQLEKIKCNKYLEQDLIEQWLLINSTKNFFITLKNSPYSDKDCMIIYWWEDRNIKSINCFNNYEKDEFFDILNTVNNWLQKEYKEEIENWEKELILWINTSIKPWIWWTQSVQRPHFHLSILSTKENEFNNIKTEEVFISHNEIDHVKHFCIRKINRIQLTSFLTSINTDLKKY